MERTVPSPWESSPPTQSWVKVGVCHPFGPDTRVLFFVWTHYSLFTPAKRRDTHLYLWESVDTPSRFLKGPIAFELTDTHSPSNPRLCRPSGPEKPRAPRVESHYGSPNSGEGGQLGEETPVSNTYDALFSGVFHNSLSLLSTDTRVSKTLSPWAPATHQTRVPESPPTAVIHPVPD